MLPGSKLQQLFSRQAFTVAEEPITCDTCVSVSSGGATVMLQNGSVGFIQDLAIGDELGTGLPLLGQALRLLT